MNYLAHAYLSANDPALATGNFIADHLKGMSPETFPPEVAKGIMLHRRIDMFTDGHPAFRQSKRIFYNGFEKYSGVLVDIYTDHFLARDFLALTGEPLDLFARRHYDIYRENERILPVSARRFLDYVTRNDVFSAYARLDGIETVLSHLSHRIGRNVALQGSLDLFLSNEAELHARFSEMFRDAVTQLRPA
jgi:acyl carrier protein phosphodiesterase